LTIEESKEWPD